MYKLNNKGWGLGIFLVYLLIFIFAIFLVTILINKTGLSHNSESIMETNEEKVQTYEEYEQIVKQATEKYREEHYPYLVDGDVINIDINSLDISKEITKKCNGYVVVERNTDSYLYTPYLNCNQYN